MHNPLGDKTGNSERSLNGSNGCPLDTENCGRVFFQEVGSILEGSGLILEVTS